MNKYEIIEKWAKERVAEKIVMHFKTPAKKDLCQYIYMYLLTNTPETLIQELQEKNEYRYYIARMVVQQVASSHSVYYNTYVRHFDSINKESKDGNNYEETITYDDTPSHQLEDEVDDYLNSLPERDKEMLWLQLIGKSERTDDIRNIRNRYNLTQNQYTVLVPKLKENFCNHFKIKKENKQKGKYNSTKVQMIDYKTGKIVKVFSNFRECKLELEPKGYNIKSIYSCLISRQKQYNGYIFRYIR